MHSLAFLVAAFVDALCWWFARPFASAVISQTVLHFFNELDWIWPKLEGNMIPELQEAISIAQENLYRGFISSKRSGIDWLNVSYRRQIIYWFVTVTFVLSIHNILVHICFVSDCLRRFLQTIPGSAQIPGIWSRRQCGNYGNGLPLPVANCGLHQKSGTNSDDRTGAEVCFVGKCIGNVGIWIMTAVTQNKKSDPFKCALIPSSGRW